ncbi:MAG TPA: methyltransferase, FxLD system [Candidatus Baltobacteraceae bacterium]|jgi:protein-L-isoaspartate(D-aspartate) O-methyltransferase|nr:methyltransferase, FxLD system [Candidatus Baltobacteraceae bacterium]
MSNQQPSTKAGKLHTTSVELLRTTLISQLQEEGAIRSDRVVAAFHAVPRHLFLPEVTLESAYANDTVITKRDEYGTAISAVSAPWLQARMLEQADLRPGMRCLEIGSGGYNAALMAELVGETGEVTTVDIDSDVVNRARQCLENAGYTRVNVVLADAENGVKEHAPYDRIIVTVDAWDIPPAWTDQLTAKGRIVVPLRMRGVSRSIAFEREDGYLVSLEHIPCGFVPMQGTGTREERLIPLYGEEVFLRIDGGQEVDTEGLRRALLQPRVEAWSGVCSGGMEPFDGQHFWLASILPDFCLLTHRKTELARSLVSPSSPMGTPTLLDGRSFAYHAFRKIDSSSDTFEFGAFAHGPDAARLAEQMNEQLCIWDRDHRHGPAPRIIVYPVGAPDEPLPNDRIIDKRHTRVAISWPSIHHAQVQMSITTTTNERKDDCNADDSTTRHGYRNGGRP